MRRHFSSASDDRRSSFEVPRITKLLQSIEFYDSIVVIRKADGERDVPASVFTADPAAPPQH